jgi:hypothetical protein
LKQSPAVVKASLEQAVFRNPAPTEAHSRTEDDTRKVHRQDELPVRDPELWVPRRHKPEDQQCFDRQEEQQEGDELGPPFTLGQSLVDRLYDFYFLNSAQCVPLFDSDKEKLAADFSEVKSGCSAEFLI